MPHYIDTTLREGFQSGIELFRSNEDMISYASAALATGLPDRFEISRPRNPQGYIPAEVFWGLADQHGEAMQVYCGPVHSFVPETIEGLAETDCNWLSFTLVHSDDIALDGLRKMLEGLEEFSIRIGIECIANKDPNKAATIVRYLADIPQVKQVNLNDSNGILDPTSLEALILKLPKLEHTTYGFHFHDDLGFAAENLRVLHEAPPDNHYYCDVAFNGLGERAGITSMQSAADLTPRFRVGVANLAQFFTNSALRFAGCNSSGYGVQADSHYDENGQLRQEYVDIPSRQ